MKSKSRRPVRSERLAAAIAREDPYGSGVDKGPGFGRVVFVVILLHAVAIGGFAAYKWIHPDPPGSGAVELGKTTPQPAKGTDTEGSGADQSRPQRREKVTPFEIKHPEIPGAVRYRVMENETLVEIARRFRASVAEVEKLNELKPGQPLVPGILLTVPDHRAGDGPGSQGSGPIVPKVLGGGGEAAPKPVPVPVEPAQVLKPEPAPKEEQGPVEARKEEGKTYRVLKGDTAYSIARRHQVDWQELLRHNGLSDPRQLQAGQVLRIP